MKKSAGILVYKLENDKIKVLLTHPGGPYWQNTHLHSWGIPKGEQDPHEKLIDTAIREFKEETNLNINKENLSFLASRKVSNNKLVTIFFKESDFDLKKCKSNTFSLEWPQNSGIFKTFPENDKFEWIDLEEAEELIFVQQIPFLRCLKAKLNRVN